VTALVAFALVARADDNAILPSNAAPPWKAPGLEEKGFDWSNATRESLRFLTIQHGIRLTQEKTFDQLSGPFWADYFESLKGLKTWKDGDSAFTNYVAHPMQGAVTGYIQVQNDPKGKRTSITDGSVYWRSRLKAMAWSAAYSTQFELGPYSEATIGNVGRTPGTMGYVDLVMTPTGGFGMMVAEDAFDHFVVSRLERRVNPPTMRFLRMVFSPNRTLANVLRFKKPWRRDNRDYTPRVAGRAGTSASTDD
jgi:hypothetical protein